MMGESNYLGRHLFLDIENLRLYPATYTNQYWPVTLPAKSLDPTITQLLHLKISSFAVHDHDSYARI